MVTNTVPDIINVKVKLTVDSINALLLRNFTLTQIAKAHNCTQSAVTQYIQRYPNHIIYDKGSRDLLLTAKTDRIVNQGLDHINTILTNNQFDKKDMQGLSVTTGVMFDKMRILQDKSTQNVSIATVTTNMEERKARREELLKELDGVD